MTKLYLTPYASKKLRYYVDQCPEEISGFGKVEVMRHEGEPYLVVTDLLILEQECSGAHSTMDEDSIGKLLYELTKNGEDLSVWRLWWHSHADMRAFFSGTDTSTIDSSREFTYLVSLVTNHAGDYVARIDFFDPLRLEEELEVEILPEVDEELKALCKKEIEEKVSLSESRAGYYTGGRLQKGSKKWRKTKARLGLLTLEDEGYDFNLAEYNHELGCMAHMPPKKETSTSKDKEKSSTQESSKQKSQSSAPGILARRHVLDLDDLD